MAENKLSPFAERGLRTYDEKLKAILEPGQKGKFIAVDPDTGDYYLGKNVEEAFEIARKAHPDRLFLVTRVGYPSAVEFGYGYPEG